jgi:hypothetical protein
MNWFRPTHNAGKRIEYCSLMGCTKPQLRPHHHHFEKGHLTGYPCQCSDGGEPGINKEE